MKKIFLAYAMGALLITTGCASIVSDSSYPVTINSSPDGADFAVLNTDSGLTVMKGRTPATVSLRANSGFFNGADYAITFTKDGYDGVTYPLTSTLDGWYIGNILFGGLIGMLIVDPATGAMWRLNEGVSVSLPTSANAKKADENTLSILTLDQLPANYHEHLERLN